MQHLASVPERRSSFAEEKTLAALTQPVRSKGWLEYRRPDHFEKVTTEPIQESLMVDGDRLSIVAGDQARVLELDFEPPLRALVDAVRGTLAGDLGTLRRSYDVAMQGSVQDWRLTLTPKDASLTRLLRQVVVDGADTDLRSVRITQSNGDQSLMTIRPAT